MRRRWRRKADSLGLLRQMGSPRRSKKRLYQRVAGEDRGVEAVVPCPNFMAPPVNPARIPAARSEPTMKMRF